MKISYFLAIVACSAIFVALRPLPSIAADATKAYRPLKVEGFLYPNACLIDERKNVESSVLKLGVKEASEAWRIIDLLTCAPRNDSTRKSVTSLMATKLRVDFSSTGDQPSAEVVAPSAQIVERVIRAGEAWSPQVREESGDVIVQYFVDEACVRDVTLKYRKSTWLIHGIGMACD
ncbi:hypothetical protein QPK31_14695 [Massilia sp. YIM B02769]|uniref:hypothetical protein n=1 Tax=Massilia sp. YIM B02769 TaxID=3050129 RepID=UPI0025B68A84|nr:hypothetical protein [Massilia sp. YIM B02769]MDN4059472.1 hypothetical protein [Massilia sp. YIM B02769]